MRPNLRRPDRNSLLCDGTNVERKHLIFMPYLLAIFFALDCCRRPRRIATWLTVKSGDIISFLISPSEMRFASVKARVFAGVRSTATIAAAMQAAAGLSFEPNTLRRH